MTDTLQNDKNDEIYENFETDDNKEEALKKKKNKSKLVSSFIISIVFLLIFAGFIYYKYFHRTSNSSSLAVLEEYNELGKKDDNLKLSLSTELCLERRKYKFLNIGLTFHFNKDDIDKNRLLKALKILIENQAILQSIFFKKDGKYHIKFDKNLYPEIIQKTMKESDYKNYIDEIEQHIDFPLNKLMYKIYIIQTEESFYLIFLMHHTLVDKMTSDALINTLNKAYMNDTIPFKSEDLYYAHLYEFNLKLRNDRKFYNDVKNYFFNNYDLGRTFKSYRVDKDIQKPLEDTMTFFIDISSKALRDKIYSIFEGKFSRISMFNLICQLYTLYLYNNMEDHRPEILYVRHGRNLKFYKNSMGCFLQDAFINYDFAKNSIKIKDKNYLNVQEFYDNAKKQFYEQRDIDGFINTFENYDSFRSFDNLVSSQSYQVDELDETMHPKLLPKYLFGKKLLEKTRNKIIFVVDSKEKPYANFFFQNIYIPNGIMNQFQANADYYKVESLKKISDLFYKVVDILSDGFLRDDKLIEIKMLD